MLTKNKQVEVIVKYYMSIVFLLGSQPHLLLRGHELPNPAERPGREASRLDRQVGDAAVPGPAQSPEEGRPGV